MIIATVIAIIIITIINTVTINAVKIILYQNFSPACFSDLSASLSALLIEKTEAFQCINQIS